MKIVEEIKIGKQDAFLLLGIDEITGKTAIGISNLAIGGEMEDLFAEAIANGHHVLLKHEKIKGKSPLFHKIFLILLEGKLEEYQSKEKTSEIEKEFNVAKERLLCVMREYLDRIKNAVRFLLCQPFLRE